MAKKKNKEAKGEGAEKAKEGEKNSSEQNDESQKKKEPPKEPPPLILKADFHCEGCASKLCKHVRSFPGVQSVKADMASGMVTVVGPVDPLQLRDFIEQKTKKSIELVSPIIAKEKKTDEKKDENKQTEVKTEMNQKAKEAPLALTTSVIKMSLHCQGCIDKIYKISEKTKGVLEVTVDKQKETITVKGTMDVAALAASLTEKLKRNAEVVPTKQKDKEVKVNEEKKKKSEDNGGGKKADGAGTAPLPGNRIDYMAGVPGFPGGPSLFGPQYLPSLPPPGQFIQPGPIVWLGQSSGSEPGYGYPVTGYPPHMKFNDENPDACIVM